MTYRTATDMLDRPPAPRLASGVELLGEYEDSGFKEPPCIARRGDGQTLQLTPLLYSVAAQADGERDYAAIAEAVSADTDRRVSADNVRFLIENKLRPLGVVAAADGSSPNLERPDLLLGLKFRTAVVPERITRPLTTIFRPLYRPPVVVAVIVSFLALDAWLFLSHGIAPGLRHTLYEPLLLVGLFAAIVVATAFHEIGHATACRYSGGRPGAMGVGIYLVWPAFYTDVTDAYRLNRTGRLRTDLGGIYFNAIFALAMAALYALTGFEPVLLVVLIQNFAMLQQLLPLVRLDGYYILSDLAGVPDMFSRIKPVFRSLLPGAHTHPQVAVLKPWVRHAVTVYVLTVVPVLVFVLLLALLHAPRMFATAFDSLGVQYEAVGSALDDGAGLGVAAGALQILALSLPLLGLTLTFGRVGSRAGRGAWAWSEGHPERRAGVVGVATAGLALAVFTWWPNGDYRPIQPGEKGTVPGALAAVSDIPSGRPSLTPERAEELGGAPTARSLDGDTRLDERPSDPSAREPRDARPTSTSGTGVPAGSGPEQTPAADPAPAAGTEPSPAEPAPATAGSSPADSAPPAETAAPTATPTATPTPTPTATPAETPSPAPTTDPPPTPTP